MTTAKRAPRTVDAAGALKLGRRHTRELLADFGADWDRVWMNTLQDGTVQINRGDEGVMRFRWAELRAALPPAEFRLFGSMFELLTEQANFAQWAMHVAAIELGTHAKRKIGPGNARQRAAEARDKKLVTEAIKLREKKSDRSVANIAGILSDRGLGGKESIRKKLLRLL